MILRLLQLAFSVIFIQLVNYQRNCRLTNTNSMEFNFNYTQIEIMFEFEAATFPVICIRFFNEKKKHS